jgi:hypothetical protein
MDKREIILARAFLGGWREASPKLLFKWPELLPFLIEEPRE